MAAARKGEADMAISNALRSNMFDILMGLGLPWLIAAILGRPVVFIGVSRLLYWVALLVATLGTLMTTVAAGGWRLSFNVGAALVSMYGIYVVWALLKSIQVVP